MVRRVQAVVFIRVHQVGVKDIDLSLEKSFRHVQLPLAKVYHLFVSLGTIFQFNHQPFPEVWVKENRCTKVSCGHVVNPITRDRTRADTTPIFTSVPSKASSSKAT